MEVIINGVRYIPDQRVAYSGLSLPEILKRARKLKRETVSEASEAIGINKRHLQTLEAGDSTNPTLSVLRGMVHHYGLDPNEILKGDI